MKNNKNSFDNRWSKKKLPKIAVYLTAKEWLATIKRHDILFMAIPTKEKMVAIRVEGNIAYHDLKHILKAEVDSVLDRLSLKMRGEGGGQQTNTFHENLSNRVYDEAIGDFEKIKAEIKNDYEI